jgi:hypothetical protein
MIGIFVVALVLKSAESPNPRSVGRETVVDDYLHRVPGYAICTVLPKTVSREEAGGHWDCSSLAKCPAQVFNAT